MGFRRMKERKVGWRFRVGASDDDVDEMLVDGNGTPRRAFPQSPPQVCRSSRAAYCEAAVRLERRC